MRKYFSLRAIYFALLIFCGQHSFAQTPTKLWSIDLGVDKDFHQRLNVHEVLLTPPSVSFLNNDQIICAFYDGEEIGFNPSLNQHGFHVLEIDSRNGAFGRKLDFQSVDDHSRALPIGDIGFVVLAGQELRKFDTSFSPGSSYPTPIESPNQRPNLWLMDVAPTGETILIYRHRVGEQGKLFWLHSTDLSQKDAAETKPIGSIRASDTAAIFDGASNRELFQAGAITVLCKLCDAYFLTDSLLFVNENSSYSIETTSGIKQSSGRVDTRAADFARAANAPRFAYLSGHLQGSGFPIKTNFKSITGKITVMDWTTNKRVAEVEINEQADNPSAGLTQSALALSSDGKILLALIHHTLSCYRLP